MKRAYSYIRMSTPEQLRGDSLRRQLSASEDWCLQHGYVLDSSLRDLGVSAFKGANRLRGALGRFIELAESGQVDRGSVLLVESLDRLSRQEILTSLGVFTDLLNAGVEVVTLADGYRYTQESINDLGNLIVSLVVMSRAHEESAMKSRRVTASWADKRERAATEPVTSIVPLWLRMRDGKIEPIPERVAIVRQIFLDTIDGLGRRKIVSNLNERGVPPFGKSAVWSESYVQKLLRSRAVLGEYQPQTGRGAQRRPVGEPIPAYYPQVIDETTFYRAQAAMDQRRTKGGRRGKRFGNLLTGLCRCGECGATMRFSNPAQGPKRGRGPYLACSHAVVRGGCSHRHYYPYKGIEGIALHWITEAVDVPGELGVNQQKSVSLRAEREAAEAKLSGLEQAIENYALLFETADPATLAPAMKRYSSLLEERAATADQVEQLRADASTQTTTQADLAEALFGALSPVAKTEEEHYTHRARFNQMLRRVVKEIRITPHQDITAELMDGRSLFLSNLADNDAFERDMRVFQALMRDLADEGLDRWIERQPWYGENSDERQA